MEALLFLCHRIPYPPDKGDKIRAWHVLKQLLTRYRVHLGTFIDDPADRVHLDFLKGLCASVHAVEIAPTQRRLLSLRGLLGNEALGLTYYRDPSLARWVSAIRREVAPRKVLVFSSTMAQYVCGPEWSQARRVIDFVDVDSEKWADYAAQKPWPLSALYAREARCLRRFEARVATTCDASVFVSKAEAEVFSARVSVNAAQVHAVENGVDLQYFARDPHRPSPYPRPAPVLVFTGAMDYWANEDAVQWFATAVWPLVLAARPDAEFWIVGARPSAGVLALGQLPQVFVTGRVPDTRPYLQHAALAVAPLRIARGVQNKVLEALSMELAVIATPAACAGLHRDAPPHALACAEAPAFAQQILNRLGEKSTGGRAYVKAHHHWGTTLRQLNALLEVA